MGVGVGRSVGFDLIVKQTKKNNQGHNILLLGKYIFNLEYKSDIFLTYVGFGAFVFGAFVFGAFVFGAFVFGAFVFGAFVFGGFVGFGLIVSQAKRTTRTQPLANYTQLGT